MCIRDSAWSAARRPPPPNRLARRAHATPQSANHPDNRGSRRAGARVLPFPLRPCHTDYRRRPKPAFASENPRPLRKSLPAGRAGYRDPAILPRPASCRRTQRKNGRFAGTILPCLLYTSSIGGDLILDRSAFTLPIHNPAEFDNEPLRPYNAGPDALLVNLKSLRLTLSPDAVSYTHLDVYKRQDRCW